MVAPDSSVKNAFNISLYSSHDIQTLSRRELQRVDRTLQETSLRYMTHSGHAQGISDTIVRKSKMSADKSLFSAQIWMFASIQSVFLFRTGNPAFVEL
jgi:hypothetical protein